MKENKEETKLQSEQKTDPDFTFKALISVLSNPTLREIFIADNKETIAELRALLTPSKSQLPIEQKTVEEILKKHLPEFPELGIRGGEVYDNTGRPATCDVQNAMEEYASQFKSQLPINQNILNLIKEADAWLSFNTSPSAEQIMQFRKSLQEVIAAESQPLPIEGENKKDNEKI